MSEQERSIPEREEEWKEILTEKEYQILREAGTEPRFSGDLLD
ncbi:peptide-methionine (R)-S-oxide reductase, partial [Halobacteriales archaeon QH_10_65_19]